MVIQPLEMGVRMAGYSKFTSIKHRKATQNLKRGKIFIKLIHEITVATKEGGLKSGNNSRLRATIDKVLSHNMIRDTINRAVIRGADGENDENMETVMYEGYGPAEITVMVESMTDNRNRTVPGVRHAFSKSGGNLGTDGSVNYLFHKKRVISYEAGLDEDEMMEVALNGGADDIETHDGGLMDIYTTAADFSLVKDVLDAAGFEA